MAIVDSLKKLLTKFGGDTSALAENATSSDVIDAITEAYTDKEGTYVEVTPVLSEGTKIATITTNNTEHDIFAPASSGGASFFDVTISYDTSGAKFVSNKTFAEISAAFAAGSIVRAFVDMTDYSSTTYFGTGYVALTSVPYYDNAPFNFVFSTLQFIDSEDKFGNYSFTIYDNSGTTAVIFNAYEGT